MRSVGFRVFCEWDWNAINKDNREKEANLLCVHNVSAICAHGREQRLERYRFKLV